MKHQRPILIGAALATATLIGVGSVGAVSAATDNSTNGASSIVDKLASKFNLNKDEVQAVFDEERKQHQAEHQAEQKQHLAQAVTDGTLTQAQADYITKAQAEIKSLMGDGRPDQLDEAARQQIRDKMAALRTWADDNNVDMRYVMGGGRGHGPGGPGGRGMMDGPRDDDSSSTTQSS